MLGKTHVAGGVLSGILVGACAQMDLPSIALCCAVGGIGGAIVDLDHHNSLASRRSGPVGFVTSHIFQHRGVMHTPVFYLVCNSLLWLLAAMFMPDIPALSVSWGWLILALAAGEFSHLVLDSLNPSGIMWLYPLTKKRLHLMKIRTGSTGDAVCRTICVLASVVMMAVQFRDAIHLEQLVSAVI